MRETAEGLRSPADRGLGCDVEAVSTFKGHDATSEFIRRNFTAPEVVYCMQAADTAASFAGRWAAKEAVIKAISNASLGSRPLWKSEI